MESKKLTRNGRKAGRAPRRECQKCSEISGLLESIGTAQLMKYKGISSGSEDYRGIGSWLKNIASEVTGRKLIVRSRAVKW